MNKKIINGTEYFVIGQYKFLGIDILKFMDSDGNILFATKKGSQYCEIKNRLALKTLNSKFAYDINTDINGD